MLSAMSVGLRRRHLKCFGTGRGTMSVTSALSLAILKILFEVFPIRRPLLGLNQGRLTISSLSAPQILNLLIQGMLARDVPCLDM